MSSHQQHAPKPRSLSRIGVADLHAIAHTELSASTGQTARPPEPGASESWDAVSSSNSDTPRQLADHRQLIRVLAAHAGAGASTTALAMAEVATQDHRSMLVDSADPAWSCLIYVEHHDRGQRGDWLISDRGSLVVARAAGPRDDPFARRDLPGAPAEVTIHDIGWSLRELARHRPGWSLDSEASDVLVTRCTLIGIQHTEQALRALDRRHREIVQLAVIGNRRQTALLRSAGGPCIRARCEADAMTWLPLLPSPPGALAPIDRLPRVLLNAARHLLDRSTCSTAPRAAQPRSRLLDRARLQHAAPARHPDYSRSTR